MPLDEAVSLPRGRRCRFREVKRAQLHELYKTEPLREVVLLHEIAKAAPANRTGVQLHELHEVELLWSP